jgi:hypothetical protein
MRIELFFQHLLKNNLFVCILMGVTVFIAVTLFYFKKLL